MTNYIKFEAIKFRDLLSSVIPVIDNEKFISRNIYHCFDRYYLVLGGSVADGGCFIRSYLWAPSDGAAMRAINQDCNECHLEVIGNLDGIIPDITSLAYAGLIDYFKGNLNERVMESASYRIDDGVFVHKKIETEKYIFFFSESDVVEADHPYAILFKLSK